MTPFEALCGYKPIQLPMGVLFDSMVPATSILTRDRQALLQLLCYHFQQAQNRMKYFADRKRTERNWRLGIWFI